MHRVSFVRPPEERASTRALVERCFDAAGVPADQRVLLVRGIAVGRGMPDIVWMSVPDEYAPQVAGAAIAAGMRNVESRPMPQSVRVGGSDGA